MLIRYKVKLIIYNEKSYFKENKKISQNLKVSETLALGQGLEVNLSIGRLIRLFFYCVGDMRVNKNWAMSGNIF